MAKEYKFGCYATVEVDGKEFRVFNQVTGLLEKTYGTWGQAKAHATELVQHYKTLNNRGFGWQLRNGY